MKEAIELIKDGIDILMDKALPETEQIKEILEKFKKL
jgi:divalent metal cation (Fe/Co/Zn/Cd) transporter